MDAPARPPLAFDVAFMNAEPVPALVRQVELAEALGFDTAWITDSHLVCRELWVTLAACALATRRIRIGPGVTVPHTRHATVTASAAATLAELAPGRVVLGFGTGGSSAETMGLGLRQAARVRTLEALVTSVRTLLARGTVSLETGAAARLAWLDAPRPLPLYVAGSGPRMLEAAGRLGDGVILYVGVDPDLVRAGLACVAAGAAAVGRSLDTLDVALWVPTGLDRDGGRAREHVRGRVASAMRHPLPAPLSPADEAALRRLREAYDPYQHAHAQATHRALVPDRFVELMALAGTPEEVAAQVRRLAALPELRRVILLPQVPGGGVEDRSALLRLFAEEVRPRL
jgi:5,10-methylenetetrahydromethanopterin reductase